MTIDKQKLKALAEATGGVTWSWWTSNSLLRLTTEQAGRHGPDGDAVSAHGNNVACASPYREFIEAASPATVLALVAEIETLHDRAAYWRQRAKSAEGHLYGGDFQAACKQVQHVSNYADTPLDQLDDRQKARISSVVHAVLRAVNAERDLRRPADVTGQRDKQDLTRQEDRS